MSTKITFNPRFRSSILYSFFILTILLSCNKDNNVLSPNEQDVDSHKTSDYILPYPVGQEYQCIQGNNEGNHTNLYQYAQDFAMQVNSYITAARKGKVIYIKENIVDNYQSLLF